jgi:hypothetical protein
MFPLTQPNKSQMTTLGESQMSHEGDFAMLGPD